VQGWLEAADINERQDAIVSMPNGKKHKIRYTVVKKKAHYAKASEYTTVSVEEVK
jgi:hypothetical protein